LTPEFETKRRLGVLVVCCLRAAGTVKGCDLKQVTALNVGHTTSKHPVDVAFFVEKSTRQTFGLGWQIARR
jgi:hypothetical protein